MDLLAPPEGYCREKLDRARHDRAAFRSGTDELDNWIQQHALAAQKRGHSATHVLCDAEAAREFPSHPPGASPRLMSIRAFATLVSVEVPLMTRPGYKIPALLLAQMAVEESRKGTGLGKHLVRFACHCAVDQHDKSGCGSLLVKPLNADVSAFYTKLGFEDLGDGLLHLPIAAIKKTLS